MRLRIGSNSHIQSLPAETSFSELQPANLKNCFYQDMLEKSSKQGRRGYK
jgi:hypothetical protein